MTGQMAEFDSELERRAAEMLTRDGYRVQAQPNPTSLPFDLGGYRPDLLAVRDDEKLLVEVKGSALRLPIERYQRIAEDVSSHAGWRFVLVTPDDISAVCTVPGSLHILTWDEIRKRASDADELIRSGQNDAALLLLWTAFEAAMRRQAQEIHIPVERLPISVLLKHLYSNGELSMNQYDRVMRYLQTRNQAVHGYEVEGLDEASDDLRSLLNEVLTDWVSVA
jgi:hypothetical protein